MIKCTKEMNEANLKICLDFWYEILKLIKQKPNNKAIRSMLTNLRPILIRRMIKQDAFFITIEVLGEQFDNKQFNQEQVSLYETIK